VDPIDEVVDEILKSKLRKRAYDILSRMQRREARSQEKVIYVSCYELLEDNREKGDNDMLD